MPLVLWVLYCGMMVFMAPGESKVVHLVTVGVAAAALAVWLLWTGFVAGIAVRVALGTFLVFLIVLVIGMACLGDYLERRRSNGKDPRQES